MNEHKLCDSLLLLDVVVLMSCDILLLLDVVVLMSCDSLLLLVVLVLVGCDSESSFIEAPSLKLDCGRTDTNWTTIDNFKSLVIS